MPKHEHFLFFILIYEMLLQIYGTLLAPYPPQNNSHSTEILNMRGGNKSATCITDILSPLEHVSHNPR